MTQRNLQGRTAFVTGSSQGVGAAIAVGLARAGANLVLHGLRRDERAQATVEACQAYGNRVAFIEGDLCGNGQACVDQIASRAARELPQIDVLVNNAGGYFDRPFLELDYETFDRTLRLNVYAYFFMTQWFARRWVEQGVRGRVLLVGSINGRLAEREHASYDISKGAVEMMVRTLCVELAPHGIRVNGLAPGLFETPLTAPALADPHARKWMELHTPNGQVPGPEAAAEAAVFLLGDGAAHIHGQMLLVDGGMSAWQQPEPPATVPAQKSTGS